MSGLEPQAMGRRSFLVRAGGGVVLPVQSLEWHRSFRPLSAAALAGSRLVPLLRSRGVLHPLGWIDGALRRRRSSLHPAPASGCRVVEASPEEFFSCAGRMMERFAIRPVESLEELAATGFSRAIIPWTDAISFYRKACGAEPAHRFLTYTSRP